MHVSFRHGIVQHKQPNFLQINPTSVTLLADYNNPLLVAIAFGHANYLITESFDIPEAWTNTPATDCWLYIDINKLTAEKTFGFTIHEPKTESIAPNNPTINQHWFNTADTTMYVWDGNTWQSKIRIFVCMLQNGTIPVSISLNSPIFTGTQIGITGNFNIGQIIFDSDNNPLKLSNDEFATTNSTFRLGLTSQTEVKLSSIILEAIAEVTMLEYTIVQLTDFGTIGPATPFTTQLTSTYGIIERSVNVGNVAQYTTTGIITNPNWNWTSIGPNALLYVDNFGQLTSTEVIPEQVPVATVLDKHTISLNIKNIIRNINQPPKSSSSNTGTVRLSVPPVNPADPIAVGDNDPRLSLTNPPAPHTHPITDIVNLTTTLDSKLNISGGTLTGPLILNNNPTQALEAVPKQYIDNLSLNDLSNVVIAGAFSNQLLSFNGVNWVNSDPIIPTVTLTGDITGQDLVDNNIITTLATVNSTIGIFGSSTQVGRYTVDAKGRILNATNVTIQPDWSNILSTPTTLSGYGITDATPASHITNGTHLTPSQSSLLNNITVTATEINTLTGVTSDIQPQLDNKVSKTSSTTFSNGVNLTLTNGELFGLPAVPTAGSAAVSKTYVDNTIATGVSGPAIVLAGSGLVYPNGGSTLEVDIGTELTFSGNKLTLTTTGVTAGTYKSVTVNAYGRVTAGTTPTTLSGFGITDGVIANTAITPGTATKISYDEKGLILSGTTLSQGDIPNITQSQVINLTTDLNGKQPLNATLTAIGALTDTNGYLFINSGGTWSISSITLNSLLPSQTGHAGQVLSTDGTNTSWITMSSGGTPGGINGQLQYNNGGNFAGASGITTDGTNLTVTGNLILSGTNRKILADFDTSYIQTSNINSTTNLRVVPSGTATSSSLSAFNGIDTNNSSMVVIGIDNLTSYISSSKNNTGLYIPLSFRTSNADRITLDVSGNIVLGSGGLTPLATEGFVYIPIIDGTPVGTPVDYNGRIPIAVDVGNSKIYGYDTVTDTWLNLSGTGGGGGGQTLTLGTHLTGTSYNGSAAVTTNVIANSANVVSTIVTRDAVGNFNAGTITASLNGNATTVTDGVYTTGTYSNPSWITSLAGSKISGNISGSASSITSTLPISLGGTGNTTSTAAFNALAPSQTGNAGKILTTDGTNTSWITNTGGSSSGTVTSIDVSGGTTGLTTTGGPVTTSGTITLTGTLSVSNGGTGATTVTTAINNLLPSQSTHNGHVLTTDGTNISWSAAGGGSGTTTNPLTFGSYLTGGPTFDGSVARTIAVDATITNTASKIVARDSSGNFSAGTITASLNGNATTATTAGNVTGVVAIANGGTGLTTIGTANQLLRVNSTATGLEFFTASGGVGSPGGTNGQLQYNSGGVFGGATFETDGNNLTFVGLGRRIIGDFSDATLANRLSFQTSVTNSFTGLQLLPNGTSTNSFVLTSNNSDVDNSSYSIFGTNNTTTIIASQQIGSGSFLPISFQTNNTTQLQILAGTNSANYVTIQGNSSTLNPHISVNGSDTNISLSLKAKGSTGVVQIDSNGTIATLNVGGNTLSTGTANIEIGTGRSGSGQSHIDLVGDTTYSDFGLRIIRNNTGANTTSQLIHRGTGTFSIITQEVASLSLNTSNTTRLLIDSVGNIVTGTGALATTATNGFLYIPTMAGPPTGVPTLYSGQGPIVFDTANNNLYLYDPIDNSWSNLTGAGAVGSAAGITGSVQFNTANVITGSTNFIWDNTNNRLGINQSTPTVALDVVGAIKSTNNISGLNFTSTQTTGTAPFTIASTTLVSNLNADLLDGQHGTFYQNASNITAGTLPIVRGGTNLSAVGTINQVLGVTTLGGALEYKNITGGSNIVISYTSGNITISGTSKGVPGGTTVSDTTGDPYFNNVTLLAHFNGTNGSTTFTDVKGHTITSTGTIISTTQFMSGGSSAFFDGTTARLDIATSSDFGFETSDFTIEFWVYPTSITADSILFDMRSATSDEAIMLYISSISKLTLFVNNVDVIVDTGTISVNQWTHVALVKSNNVTTLYKNIVQIGSAYTDNNFYGATRGITIGDSFDTNHKYFTGYMDDLRVTKGIARTLTTLPTIQFPDVQAKAKGSIQYNNASNFYGDSNFVWDGINNRLGVNTTSPNYTLQVDGNIKINGSGFGIIFHDGTTMTTASGGGGGGGPVESDPLIDIIYYLNF